ncbi:zinc ribbon domain-containing protein [Streptococcus sp. zg-86]|uniref:Zinc ribbon domain-containing protein n=1 Tax=Streptococcus zhangguiae TaxID=2664091 RepID=A0A6I4RPS6_9STRE|nr:MULTISPECIES: zinc ribbon domain-containing protein [unclassified Streptococcus]MTB64117.1 zinc ribbon domain-containing protein [Streptococcus sp. zg-86]MTB90557.1 zinc ribbon domain-containing protein [Streptococcus sp. zg-36]MWV56105.1 zinc ribbon domain-containing protein [Streptococcus sp. zg-70]QTH48269.1 zinc ribbon domain-containing protein [Streptococcus sp. zg-86]
MDIFNTTGFKKTDKIGPLEIDRLNRVYRVHGASKMQKSSIVGGTAKAVAKTTLAIGTGGLSLVPGFLKKDKNDTDWYKFEDLVSYDLMINNQAVVSGGVGQALIGGALFGGFGAIAGGITGTRKTTTKILNMTVRITSNDFSKPVVFIDLIKKPIKNTSKDYKEAIEQAQRILGALDVITHNS